MATDNLKDFFKDLADVIREKLDSNEQYVPNDMPNIIEGISKETSGRFVEEVTVLDDDGISNGINAIKEINIISGVTTLTENAFFSCKNLEKVSFPNTLTTIGKNAFQNCSNLKKTRGSDDDIFIIPEGVQNIDNGAFLLCTSLENIIFKCKKLIVESNSFQDTKWFKNQGNGAVYAGPALYVYKGEIQDKDKDFVVKDGTTSITGSAFNNKSNLKTVKIPSSVKVIGQYAITMCSDLKEITIYGEVSLNEFSLSANPALEKVTITKLISCGLGVLRSCSNLTELILYNDDPNIQGIEYLKEDYNENFRIYAKPEMIEQWKKTTSWNVFEKYVLPLTALDNDQG